MLWLVSRNSHAESSTVSDQFILIGNKFKQRRSGQVTSKVINGVTDDAARLTRMNGRRTDIILTLLSGPHIMTTIKATYIFVKLLFQYTTGTCRTGQKCLTATHYLKQLAYVLRIFDNIFVISCTVLYKSRWQVRYSNNRYVYSSLLSLSKHFSVNLMFGV